MIIVKSTMLIVMSLLMAIIAISGFADIAVNRTEYGTIIVLMLLVNSSLSAIAAGSIFLARRSAKKWFLLYTAFSLPSMLFMPIETALPTIWLFVLSAIFSAMLWGLLTWKSDALDQPHVGATNA